MKEITLTTIFEGTIYSIEESNTHLHRVLFEDCEGVRISSPEQVSQYQGTTHFKMGFNGCGVDYGAKGLLLGAGVEEQSDQVVAVVKKLIKDGYKVKLNGIGLSRGGIAAILAALKLAHIDRVHLETNLLFLDPVPGNLLYTPFLEFLNYTLTNRSIDLSASKNLNYVETLYPYLEVGDDTGELIDKILANFHIPIRPTYPKHCQVREEVILGAHLKAFQDVNKENDPAQLHYYGVDAIPLIRKLSRAIMYQFLSRVGSITKSGENIAQSEILSEFQRERDKWTKILAKIIKNIIPKSRKLHSQDDSKITVSNSAEYLNKTHRELINTKSQYPSELCLKVEPERTYVERKINPLTKEILSDLIAIIQNKMTDKSKQGKKGLLLTGMQKGLEGGEFNEEQLSFILRDILAVVLQRDRCWYSFYSTTTSGLALIKELNQPEFSAIRDLIQFDDKPIEYSNLTTYVLGRNDSTHFNSEGKEANLSQVEDHYLGEDGYRMLI